MEVPLCNPVSSVVKSFSTTEGTEKHGEKQ